MGSTILIIDDEPDIVKVLKFWLEAKGFEIVFSHTGGEGVGMAKEKNRPQCCSTFFCPT